MERKRDYNLYRKSHYAKAFQVSRPTVDRMIKDKELETVEVGGVVFIKVYIDRYVS
jgi:predicted DNA-binding transcriptional regulator AlpA